MSDGDPRFCPGVKGNGKRCGRRLLHLDPGALKPGKRLYLKCPSCNHMYIEEGARDVVPRPAAAAAA